MNDQKKQERISRRTFLEGSWILLLVGAATLSSCAIHKKKEPAKTGGSASIQPKALDDNWYTWLVGEWRVVSGDSSWLADESGKAAQIDIAVDDQGENDLKIAFGLNGQFLIMRGHGETDELSDTQRQQLKKTTKASDEELERLLSMPYKTLQIQTIDPRTGGTVGYFFDSMRCVATGKGTREGNKEIIEWRWSATAQGATSTSILERISDDKFTLTIKYNLPDGRKMEDKAEMIRHRPSKK